MKPKILTRLANIAAKLAGSPDYDPRVKPITPLEFYADRLPVVPVPSLSDDGKILAAYGEGTYKLVQPTQPAVTPEDVVSAFESMSDEQKESVMEELGVEPAPLVVTFSGTSIGNNAACDKTWAQIQAAGNNIRAYYRGTKGTFMLVTSGDNISLFGSYTDIVNLSNPGNAFTHIICSIDDNDMVFCEFVMVV